MGQLEQVVLVATAPRVELIVKLAERCNINCTYCYYFEGNSHRFADRSAIISSRTIDDLINFINRSLTSGDASKFRLIFHGGEPLLLGKKRFDVLCERLHSSVNDEQLDLCLQTNATLIDNEWIDLFCKHRINVSTSLDGPKQNHDLSRLDKKGRGTYDQTVRGIKLLAEAASKNRIKSFGCLVVVNPAFSGRDTYNHIVSDLGITTIDFLLPDATHDTFAGDVSQYSHYLIDVFDAWWGQRHSFVHLRFMKSVVSLLLGGRSYLGGFGGELSTAFTISSDGDIELDDFLRVCGDDVIETRANIRTASINTLKKAPALAKIEQEYSEIPDECARCAFKNVCRGGQLTHRFSKGTGFRGRSIYCDALYNLFEHAAEALVLDGVSVDRIATSLGETSAGNGKLSMFAN